MKIQPLTLITKNSDFQIYSNNIVQQQKSNNYQDSDLSPTPSYNLLFKGISPKRLKAQTYLYMVKSAAGEFSVAGTDIFKMDLNKLDGIQEGINVFKGLSFKEIAFISRSLLSIAVNRGCSNLCSYCYAEAKPPQKESSEYINKMSWDDFTALTDGFTKLNNRLGFYLSAPNIRGIEYSTPFHDSDCIELSLKDNDNIEHDFIDIAEKTYESTGVLPIFDTSGWTPKNKKLQERAEKIAKYYSNSENAKRIDFFNISINPFHILNTKSVLEKRIGNIEKANKLQELYITRMANVFFTFTPLLKNGDLGIIYRAVPNKDIYPEFDGFRLSDLEALRDKILHKLKEMYVVDFKGEQKYITNKKQILSYMQKLKNKMKFEQYQSFTLTGRGIETFGKNNSYYEHSLDKVNDFNKKIKTCNTSNDLLNQNLAGILDANGKYYLTSFWSTYPTELELNFANKNKQTAPISPALQENLIVTKKLINNPNIDNIIEIDSE